MIVDRTETKVDGGESTGRVRKWLGGRVNRGWLTLPTVGLLVSSAGWLLRVRPVAPVWGTVAEWVTGLSEAAALIFLAWEISLARTDQEDRRRQEEGQAKAKREAGAKAVGVAITRAAGNRILCEITNGGLLPMYGVNVRRVAFAGTGPLTPLGRAKLAGIGGVLFPGVLPSPIAFEDPGHVVDHSLGLLIEFGDTSGYHWRRVVGLTGTEVRFGTFDEVPLATQMPAQAL